MTLAGRTSGFFAERQGAAIMKHGILRRYLRIFTSKVGSTSTENRVFYLDGYAGPGVYGDGNPGSPLLAAQVRELVEQIRDLQCIFVESNAEHAEQLRAVLSEALPSARVLDGRIEDRLADVLSLVEGAPLFAFFDPFGLGLSYENLQRVAGRNLPTDIVLNVSLAGLRRTAGHLTSSCTFPAYLKARETIITHLDAVLGGDEWREIWMSESADRAEQICTSYANRCLSLRGAYYLADVAKRWRGPVVYYLLLLTAHRDGLWSFNECLSLAFEDLRRAEREGSQEPQLFSEDYDAGYVEEIKANLIGLLAHGPVVVNRDLKEVLGTTVGYAREKHIRKAIKQLYQEGVTSTKGVGDIQPMRVLPA